MGDERASRPRTCDECAWYVPYELDGEFDVRGQCHRHAPEPLVVEQPRCAYLVTVYWPEVNGGWFGCAESEPKHG